MKINFNPVYLPESKVEEDSVFDLDIEIVEKEFPEEIELRTTVRCNTYMCVTKKCNI